MEKHGSDFDLADYYDEMWSEGDEGTWTMIEFMDTNCGACRNLHQILETWNQCGLETTLRDRLQRISQSNLSQFQYHYGRKIPPANHMAG